MAKLVAPPFLMNTLTLAHRDDCGATTGRVVEEEPLATGIARVAHARASTLAASANTRCSIMASRPARASMRERFDLRQVVHVFKVAVRVEARWVTGKGCLRHASRGTRHNV